MPPLSTTFLDRLAATSSSKRVEVARGCDVIQELSVTVRCCSRTAIPHERWGRVGGREGQDMQFWVPYVGMWGKLEKYYGINEGKCGWYDNRFIYVKNISCYIVLSHFFRLQRLSLVDNEGFHKSLLEAAISDTSSDHLRHRALDLLLWLTSIHTAAGEESLPNSTLFLVAVGD